jgi:hypothetical protein
VYLNAAPLAARNLPVPDMLYLSVLQNTLPVAGIASVSSSLTPVTVDPPSRIAVALTGCAASVLSRHGQAGLRYADGYAGERRGDAGYVR